MDRRRCIKCILFQVVGLPLLLASHAMSDWTTTGALAIGSVAVLYLGRRVLGSRDTYPLPPGPPGLPWVGNVVGVDTDAPWKTYAEWAKTYGRLQHVQFHVLSSLAIRMPVQATWFILGCWERISSSSIRKRSPRICWRTGPGTIPTVHTSSPMICESSFPFILPISIRYSSCGLYFNSVLLPYGDRWRLHRRFFHQTFRPESVHRFVPTQHRKACHLLRRLFAAPEQLHDHVFE